MTELIDNINACDNCGYDKSIFSFNKLFCSICGTERT